jgi:hypothetical protein
MFAPYCHTCRSRILLGPRRIVHFFSPGDGVHHVTLACFCGTVVESDAAPPAAAREPHPADHACAVAS